MRINNSIECTNAAKLRTRVKCKDPIPSRAYYLRCRGHIGARADQILLKKK